MSGSIEEFDDDTDFALPTAPPAVAPPSGSGPAGGMSMDNLQQMMAQMQAGGSGGGPSGDMPAGIPPGMMGMAGGPPVPPEVQLSAEEKAWVTVYPIYFDSKRRFEKGCRRVAYAEACLWPRSEELERAAARLTLMHVHEPRKTHPRDWQNPGRVKIQLFNEDGKPLNQTVPTKKALLRAIAATIQPACGGTPPPLPVHPKKPTVSAGVVKAKPSAAAPAAAKKSTAASKGGAPAATTGDGKQKQQNYKNAAAKQSKPRHRVPIRIDAHDRIKAAAKATSVKQPQKRLPVYSPSREAGILNADFGNMMGGLTQGMGPLGAMMGSMGLGGGDDDDDDQGGEDEEAKAAEERKAKDPMKQLSRRQRKRVVRVGR